MRVKLALYILRTLIRRNDPATIDEILFLLIIPSIRKSATHGISSCQLNKVLCLAYEYEIVLPQQPYGHVVPEVLLFCFCLISLWPRSTGTTRL
jgi:hypothetical protein